MCAKKRIPHVLLLIDTASAYGRGVVEGIGRYALENGPWSIQFEYRALDSGPPDWLSQWAGDGILARSGNAALAKSLLATRLPLVELFGHPQVVNAQVRIDLEAEARMVIEHFLNCGLRRFGYFAFEEVWWIKAHREAYAKALAEKGFECHAFKSPISKRSMPVWRDNQQASVVKWLRSLPRHVGICSPGDLHAVRILDACREAKISVPDEIAIVGRGNDPVICETVRPTMSSLDPDSRRIGYEAAKLLAQKMSGKLSNEEILIPPICVAVRQSTDFIVTEDADVTQAVQYIRQYACKEIDVLHVAQIVGVSRRALELKFREHLGRPPKAEIRRVRIEHAKSLLARSENTMETIAHKSGFPSAKYFTTAFYREVGMMPNAYRKMHWLTFDSGKMRFIG